MTDAPFEPVGRVMKTHGLKGEVSVAPVAEASFSLLTGVEVWFVPPVRGLGSVAISSIRQTAKGPLVTFDGIHDISEATPLAGRQMLAKSADLPQEYLTPPEETQVDGYAVEDEKHGLLGKVEETLITGANDVWVVNGPFGEVLIPVIDDVVLEIDDDASAIRVRLLPGLLPGEGE